MKMNYQTVLGELERVFSELPLSAAEGFRDELLRHERVFFHGAGRSGLMLRALAMRLAQAGRTVYIAGDTVTPAIREGDLLVVASASGTTDSVRRYARIARECGADVVCITSEGSPLLAEYPGIALKVSTKDSAEGSAQVMGSLFEQSVLIFADTVVQLLDTSGMRARHANLE